MANSIRTDVIAPIERILDEHTEVQAAVSGSCMGAARENLDERVRVLPTKVEAVQQQFADLRLSYDKCTRAYNKYMYNYTSCARACAQAGLTSPALWDANLASGENHDPCALPYPVLLMCVVMLSEGAVFHGSAGCLLHFE